MNKRKCYNCDKEVEVENKLDLMFCCVECYNEFMNRESFIRKKLSWK